MYSAQAFEYLTSGMGNGAFGVLLLRLTQKRFSATQYALLSSLFTLPRVLAGPPAALFADAIGWRDFFVATLVFGVPGMLMLQRFVPWGERDPAVPRVGAVPGAAGLARAAARLGAGAGVASGAAGLLGMASLARSRRCARDTASTWRRSSGGCCRRRARRIG